MSNTLLESDVDIFLFNTKPDALTQSSTKIAILSGTDSNLYSVAPYIEAYTDTTESKIDLNIINVISVTATNKYTNAGMGIGGANTSNKIIVVSTEAKEREFSSKSEAKKYLQEEINKVTAIKSSITDQTLKNNLQTKIDEAQKRLNSSKVFN